LRQEGQHQVLYEFYRELIRLRRQHPVLAQLSKENLAVASFELDKILLLQRGAGEDQVCALFNFSSTAVTKDLPVPRGSWRKLLDSGESRWYGAGSTVPPSILSEGELSLTLAPAAVILFETTPSSSS